MQPIQRTKIALAIGALAAAGAALAAPVDSRIALSAGASAVRGNLVTGLTNLCTTAGGLLTTFVSPSDTDITTYACATAGGLTAGAAGTFATTPDANFRNFAGTSFAVLKLNVDQGSFSAAQILNGVTITHFDPGVGASGADETPSNGTIIGGISDVEFTAFPGPVRGSFSVSVGNVGVGQTFGVGVSLPLYTAMQAAQSNPAAGGGATVDFPLPNGCSGTSRLECIPTISIGQMNAIIDSNEFSLAKTQGAQFLGGPAGAQLRYVRRVDTSGTQAAAQNYFLGLVCSDASRDVIPEPQAETDPAEDLNNDDYSNLRVLAAGSTTNVRNELLRPTTPSGAVNYAIGVLSGENINNQAWRWLRVQGAAIGENAQPNLTVTNAQTARNGQYDFYFEAKYFFSTPAQNAFWTTVSAAINTIVPPIGLLRASDLAGYNKGGNACLANSRN